MHTYSRNHVYRYIYIYIVFFLIVMYQIRYTVRRQKQIYISLICYQTNWWWVNRCHTKGWFGNWDLNTYIICWYSEAIGINLGKSWVIFNEDFVICHSFWCFGTWMDSFSIGNFIIPTDEVIFCQRGTMWAALVLSWF